MEKGEPSRGESAYGGQGLGWELSLDEAEYLGSGLGAARQHFCGAG